MIVDKMKVRYWSEWSEIPRSAMEWNFSFIRYFFGLENARFRWFFESSNQQEMKNSDGI